MSSSSRSVLLFPSPPQNATPEDSHVDQIRESVRCLTSALKRSQRQLQAILRILDEMDPAGGRPGLPVLKAGIPAPPGQSYPPNRDVSSTQTSDTNRTDRVIVLDKKAKCSPCEQQ